MPLTTCPDCAQRLSATAGQCPGCGARPPRQRSGPAIGIGGAVAAAGLAFTAFLLWHSVPIWQLGVWSVRSVAIVSASGIVAMLGLGVLAWGCLRRRWA